jgi:hypothetical protein
VGHPGLAQGVRSHQSDDLEPVRPGETAPVVPAVCTWGAIIAVFGVVHLLWLALVLLAAAGWADVISAVLRTTILQTDVTGAFRTRIASVQMAVVEGGPQLGSFKSGLVATAVSTEFAIVSGGRAGIAGSLLLASLLPGSRRFRGTAPADPEPELL